MKSISFKYYGGSENIAVLTNAPSASFKVVNTENCDWVTYMVSPTSITLTVGENASYEDRFCKLTILNENGVDYINIKQDGYRNMMVDLSLYVIIPYTYYNDNKTYDLPIRIYGGSGEFITDNSITSKIERVFESSDLYNDFVFHIDKEINGTFTFSHADTDRYIKYCKDKGIEYNYSNLVKNVVIRNASKEVMDGYTVFSFYGREYVNSLPPIITINTMTPTVISIDYSCFFNENMEFIEDSDFELKAPNKWIKSSYDKEQKKIYLKAANNTLLDRRATIVMRNLLNQKQTFTAVIQQKGVNHTQLKVQ